MRAADPSPADDRAIEAIREGLDRYFIEADRQHIRELRRRISERIEADIALLDALDGDLDLEHDDADGPEGDDEREHESTDDNGIGDYAGLWDQTGEGAASARGFAVYA